MTIVNSFQDLDKEEKEYCFELMYQFLIQSHEKSEVFDFLQVKEQELVEKRDYQKLVQLDRVMTAIESRFKKDDPNKPLF